MPEEEAGFTFVDKRRMAAETTVEAAATLSEAAATLSEEPAGLPEEAPGIDTLTVEEAEPAPTTYDLIGYCINLLASQAWQKLGLLADPQTGEAKPDLTDAKVAIDTLGDLAARMETAPEGTLSGEMRRDLRTLLNDLRLNYVSQRGSSDS